MIREELDNFNPLDDLKEFQNKLDSNLDSNQRKSVWKMNYKMKNEHSQKDAKNKVVLNTILPRTKEIIVDNMWVMRKESIKKLTD